MKLFALLSLNLLRPPTSSIQLDIMHVTHNHVGADILIEPPGLSYLGKSSNRKGPLGKKKVRYTSHVPCTYFIHLDRNPNPNQLVFILFPSFPSQCHSISPAPFKAKPPLSPTRGNHSSASRHHTYSPQPRLQSPENQENQS